MKNLILFTVLASLNISSSFAQSDFLTQVAFYGEDAASVRADCKAVELEVRSKLQAVEKKILRSDEHLINVKAKAVHEETSGGESANFVSDYCELSFISFTEALGFEKTRAYPQKHLRTKSNARAACTPAVPTVLEADENVVYARASRYYKPFKGGHQCDVIGVRVVPMLTN